MPALPPSFVEKPISEYLDSLVSFLSRFKWLSSVHAYDALHEDFYNTVWPIEWKTLADEDLFDSEQLIDLVKDGIVQDSWPDSLKDYIHQCNTLKLPRNVNLSDFGTILLDIDTSVDQSATTSSGMNRKKLHEVERFSRVIIDYVSKAGISETATIVDVGAGQGYLTHRLSTEYPCVAVDFDQIQTVGSVSRGNNIKKGYVKDIRGKKHEGPQQQLNNVERKPVVYKTILINAEKLQALVHELEQEDSGRDFVLVGLHACGDLSATAMLQTFEKCASVKLMAVVPCCFNLLTEPEHPHEVCSSHGFPMSSRIQTLCQTHSLTLGYKSRNLACQNFDRFDRQGIESNLTGHYKRSLLDALLWHFKLDPISKTQQLPAAVAVGGGVDEVATDGGERKQHKFRLGKMPIEAFEGGFLPYAMAALERLGLAGRVSEARIQEFIELPQYKNARRQIFVVHCVKSLLSRVLESLVLMDRYLTIEEMNGRNNIDVEMLNLFDINESPRNMVFLARKK
ncbi:methyltransferase domain-containing protein [Obelidium mucronatum]|nr:methyltransferase domain-containing protein [Obelidium mucronatum]